MKIKLFTIPNILTLANLICGVLALQAIIAKGDLRMAFLLVILAAIFDFLDGFAARLLKQSSPLGGELDSLADMVSFGVVPALVMVALFERGFGIEAAFTKPTLWREWGAYIPLVIAACSALRLAKFNIDESQSDVFIGMPTPACAMMCVSLGLMRTAGVALPAWAIAAISLLLAWLLISPIKMFALKFKGFGVKGNELRYGFVLLSTLLLALLNLGIAVAAIIAIYTAISATMHFACKGKGKK
ncbi:MAG: CDP-diacylglycerol--serine O-phosphatidyltransferase [Rikenellaceae bacterium]